ncbi:MAG TPA: sodium:proline symporter [Casimicrobiaceae bacterium]|nr:sodium:proline symporter [Casimicrobiaceae bacterium]
MRWRAVLDAGIAAAIASTLVEVVAWLAFAADPAGRFDRDIRFAAALAMGPGVLASAEPVAAAILLAATGVHLALSLAYAAALSSLVAAWRGQRAIAVGAVFGVALYLINMHAMTHFFPWFAADRDAVTAAAHVVFGVVAAAVYRRRALQAPG